MKTTVKKELDLHKLKHHGKIRTFNCTKCDKTFKLKNDLNNHESENHDSKVGGTLNPVIT